MIVRYRIADTGVGMSDTFVEHIFEEFAQENSSARTHYKGTGLGMAITKRYVDLMGGTISVESKKGRCHAMTFNQKQKTALFPQSRKDEGVSRKLDRDLQSRIRFLMEEHPRITAAEIHRTLLCSGDIHISQVFTSTVERFVRLVRSREGSSASKDMRRYERAHINEVWYGDTMYGPWLTDREGKKRVFFIALIDDASRFIVVADLFFNDSFENLMTVIRSAVSKFGHPGLFTFDNGSSCRNNQMELLAARIGSSVHYCEPFTPIGKSKIERWSLTVRLQYLASLDMRNFHSLEDLRRDFAGYVSRYNQTPHSSLGEKTPQECYFSEPERFRYKNSKYILLEIAESSEVRTRLCYLRDTRGFGVLTGEPGRGKTIAARI